MSAGARGGRSWNAVCDVTHGALVAATSTDWRSQHVKLLVGLLVLLVLGGCRSAEPRDATDGSRRADRDVESDPVERHQPGQEVEKQSSLPGRWIVVPWLSASLTAVVFLPDGRSPRMPLARNAAAQELLLPECRTWYLEVEEVFGGVSSEARSKLYALVGELAIPGISVSNLPEIDDHDLEEIARIGNLTHLRISGRVHKHMETPSVSDKGLASLSHLRGLQTLELSEFPSLSDAAIAGIIGRNADLEDLEIGGCPEISHSTSSAIAKSGKLTTLAVEGYWIPPRRLEAADIENMIRPRKLRRLDLGDCSGVTDTSLKGIDRLGQLEVLGLADAEELSDKTLERIGRISSLRSLGLDRCRAITDKGLARLKDLSLRELSLFGCSGITSRGLEACLPMPSLEQLDMSDCSWLDAAGIRRVLQCTSLTRLSLRNCDRIEDPDLEALRNCWRLRQLDLDGVTRLTDAALQFIAACPDLEVLGIAGCQRITDRGLAALEKLEHLRLLTALNCSGISADGMQRFSEQCPGCQVVFSNRRVP